MEDLSDNSKSTIQSLFNNLDLEEKKEILENLNYEMLFQEINKKYLNSLDTIQALENELEETKIRLKKYTAPERKKKFYQAHKEEIKEKVKEYKKTHPQKKQDPELRKARNKRYYEKKKKEKLNSELENQDNI